AAILPRINSLKMLLRCSPANAVFRKRTPGQTCHAHTSNASNNLGILSDGIEVAPSKQPRMQNFMDDVRHALRMIVKAPAFTLVAVVTLSIGIGANTAMFSVLNAVLLRPLPYAQPDRLVTLLHNGSGPVAFE